MSNATHDDIAIVGIACRFAGAANVSAFWRNVVTGKSAIGDHPNPLAVRVLDPSVSRFDRLITQRGGYLRELNTFTPGAFGLTVDNLVGVNPDQFLAMHLASAALCHACLDPATIPAGRTGLVLGYASPLNVSTANWLQHGLVLDQTEALLQRLFPAAAASQLCEIREAMKQALPPMHAQGIRSAFGYALAGQCAAALRMTGAAYAVDAGAATSLQVLRLAMDELRLGRCDIMLAGAVQSCASVQTLMGLAARLPFTTRDLPCPFSRDADGTLPGEGGGFLVLKRRGDAEKDGSEIYALLKGIGLASGSAALSHGSPDSSRLVAAMQAGQNEAGVDPVTIDLVETHGSAVPHEDQLEIQALRQVFADRKTSAPRVLVGVNKTQIGHCYAAGGLASVIKAALALYHCVLPPVPLARGRLQARLIQASSPFYIAAAPRPWVQGDHHPPRRAAVNALGCDCVQAHAVLEAYA
ncbi:MAG: polyketide synthase [Kiritimatiellia bacterium]